MNIASIFPKTLRDNKNDLSENRVPGVKDAALMFSLAVILFIYIATYFQRQGFVSGVLITQYIIILLPPLLYLLLKKMDWVYVLRLNPVSFKNLLLSTGILIFSLPLVFIVNGTYIFFLKRIFGDIRPPNIPIAEDLPQLFLFFFIIGVSAGICEEVLFRGFIMRGLQSLGPKRAVLWSAFLFAILHIHPEKVPSTFLLGLIIGFLVYRTNSIFTGMVLHFGNNAFATLLSYILLSGDKNILNNTYSNPPPSFPDPFSSPEAFVGISMLISLLIFVTLGCITTVYYLTKLLIENTPNVSMTQTQKPSFFSYWKLAWALPGLLIIVLMMIGLGLSQLNIQSDVYETIIKILYLPKVG